MESRRGTGLWMELAGETQTAVGPYEGGAFLGPVILLLHLIYHEKPLA